jgi:hypothetical protein
MEASPRKVLFVDGRRPIPYRDGSEKFSVESPQELANALTSAAQEPPHVVVVHAANGALIFVGVGGSSAAVTYYAIPKDRRALQARAKEGALDRDTWFISEGEPVNFKHLLPLETAVKIVTHLTWNSDLPNLVDWV